MTSKRIALITGANQGVGYQVAKELVAHGDTVYLGSRDLQKGVAAAKSIGEGAIAIQIDVTNRASIEAAEKRVRAEAGRLDLLVNNAGISHAQAAGTDAMAHLKKSVASQIDLDEVRAIWETNVFGALSVYQVFLPLLRETKVARIVNVSSPLGSMAMTFAAPVGSYRTIYTPGYAASKTAMNAMALAMMIELESTPDIKVNICSPAFTSTALNGFSATAESLENGSREVVRVCLLGPDGPSGTCTAWQREIPF